MKRDEFCNLIGLQKSCSVVQTEVKDTLALVGVAPPDYVYCANYFDATVLIRKCMHITVSKCNRVRMCVYYRPTGRIGHYIFRTRKLRAEESCYVL